GHDREHTGIHRRLERRQVHALDLVLAERQTRQVVVGIGVRVAVPRIVLRAGGDAGGLYAAHGRGDVPRDELCARAERPHADHRVARVCVHVGDGGDDDVGADRVHPTCDLISGRARGIRIVQYPELSRTWQGRAGARLEPGDAAALLVDADQRLRGDAMDLLAQRPGVTV